MRLDKFDLNLLVAFDVLLEERNVTRAAQRLNVTQSAMSASLKRLREAFQDDILVQHGKKMIPTSHAHALAPEVSATVRHLRMLISSGPGFDPATSQRRFRIGASDYITTVLLAPLLKILDRRAPGIRLELSLPTDETADRMANGELDMFLTPEEFVEDEHPRELVLVERHVVVGWSENPLLKGSISRQDFLASGHIAVNISERDAFIESMLRKAGIERRIEVTAPSFIQAPWLLPGTMRLALMHERLARLVAPKLDLTIVDSPFELPPMREMLQYHATRANDAALKWLRRQIIELAHEETASGALKTPLGRRAD